MHSTFKNAMTAVPVKWPNFMIVGAPKCGTTSLAGWLGGHPQAFMSEPKEPFFFCSDIEHSAKIKSIDDYRELFSSVSFHHVAIGEASTLYLVSSSAISNIERYNPRMKYIVMTRDPFEMCLSWHSHLLRNGYIKNVSVLEVFNTKGFVKKNQIGFRGLPDPVFLQYRKLCDIGEQIKRLRRIIVDESRILVVPLEELADCHEAQLRRICKFLAIDFHGAPSFEHKNEATRPRSAYVDGLIGKAQEIKRKVLPNRQFGLLNRLTKLNSSAGKARNATEMELQRIAELLQPEREKLAEVLWESNI